ncbi:hypothetical protein C0J52_09406, partial [Blattella germanica]
RSDQFPTPSLSVLSSNGSTKHSILYRVPDSIITALLVVSVKMSTIGMRLQSFTCSEKLKDAEEHDKRASARKFDESVFLF